MQNLLPKGLIFTFFVDDIKLISDTVKGACKIKASGGIRDYETAIKMIEAGASRIGTSSGAKII